MRWDAQEWKPFHLTCGVVVVIKLNCTTNLIDRGEIGGLNEQKI